MSDKNELRYKYKIKRKYFAHSAREVADGAIYDAALAFLAPYESVFVYYSFGTEADTHAIINGLLACGKRVYLPRVEGGNMVSVRYTGENDKLVENSFGISEPVGEASTDELEVCVAPLLAVNPEGYRLGYGGGYYDRFFAVYPNMVKVGLGYSLQFAEDFSPDRWDKPLDKFICEKGIVDFGRTD